MYKLDFHEKSLTEGFPKSGHIWQSIFRKVIQTYRIVFCVGRYSFFFVIFRTTSAILLARSPLYAVYVELHTLVAGMLTQQIDDPFPWP